MSLHKNLLVTTVIHKARIAIMEETYYMMSYASKNPADYMNVAAGDEALSPYYNRPPKPVYENVATPLPHSPETPSASVADLTTVREPEAMDWEEQSPGSPSAEEDDDDKENSTPVDYSPCGGGEQTTSPRLACRPSSNSSPNNLGPLRAFKRHRPGTDDDESSQPKKSKWDTASEMENHPRDEDDDTIHALRLVSVFSASLGASPGPCPAVRLVRSMSTPDLCSQQAKDTLEMMTSRPLAIAV